MYKVRFHLAAGAHFMHWQVKDTTPGEIAYYDPAMTDLTLHGCTLRNQPATARKINAGASKTVCAWIDADTVTAWPKSPVPAEWVGDAPKVAYNPRIAPHWRDQSGANVDGRRYDVLVTEGRQIY
jgi:hypothetical protein